MRWPIPDWRFYMKKEVLCDRTVDNIQVSGQDLIFIVSICLFFVIIDDGLDVRVSLFLGQLVPIDPRK